MTQTPSASRTARKRIFTTVTAVAVIGLTTACSGTSSSGGSSPSPSNAAPTFLDANKVDISGSWTSQDRHYMANNGVRGSGTERLTISDVQNGLFKATREVAVGEAYDFGTGSATKAAPLKVSGVINANGSIYMTKTGDGGFLTAWLISPDQMAASYVESGAEPIVAREILVRSTASPSTSTSASASPSVSPTGQ